MITYNIEGIEAIDTIKPLWEKLSDYHKEVSSYFIKDFEGDHYNKRKMLIHDKEQVQITIAHDDEVPIGYIVASVHDDQGEINSLFVDESYRGKDIGHELMTRSLEWIRNFDPEEIKVSVAYGNQVFSFYEKFGLYPRSVILKDCKVDH